MNAVERAQDETQEAVMTFLDRESTKRIDTHAAAVFLKPERVLKIKRSVKFPFLDYSTLEKRKAACEAEITVNRRFAPEIYRGVVAITRDADGRLTVGGDGDVVEWAVEMRRFDETRTLDHLADAGQIDEALADALGRAVARAHDAAPVVDGFGFADALAHIIAQNNDELLASSGLFPVPAVRRLSEETHAAFRRVRTLLERRERAGQVRRCHGDLHLGNIVLIDDAPVLFDAIEFDPAFATSDVLYDLAFLLMDLVERGLGPAANIVFNRYLTEAPHDDDFDALAGLPLFLSVRAAIRAKVAAARDDEEAARGYFALAQALLKPSPPRLVAVGGLSGTGKSLLARRLAPALLPAPGAVVLRSDVERKRLFGKAETDRLPTSAYTDEVTAKVYAALAENARRIITAGHSAVVDAVFARPAERAQLAQTAGTALHGLFLTADLATRMARVGGRELDASDADAAVARAQEQYDLGTIHWDEVDASGTPDETLRRARGLLGLPDEP